MGKTNHKSEVQIFIFLAIFWLFWGLIGGSEFMYYYGNRFSLLKVISTKSIQMVISTFSSVLFFFVLRSISNRRLHFSLLVPVIIITSYLFSTALGFCNTTIQNIMYNRETILYQWHRYIFIAHTKLFIFLGLSGLFYLFKYWRDTQFQKERLLKAKAASNKAKLQMLQYQLNPHFLFNSLNSIRSLVYEDAKKTDLMITNLTEFLRFSLSNNNDFKIDLKDEIQMLQNYLDIQKTRFEENLIIDQSIQRATLGFKIPRLLIHPLVENAIKYGMVTSAKPLKIELLSRIKSDQWEFQVSNTGKLVESESDISFKTDGTKTGLLNLKNRLEIFFPDKHCFQICENNGWVHASLSVNLDCLTNGENC